MKYQSTCLLEVVAILCLSFAQVAVGEGIISAENKNFSVQLKEEITSPDPAIRLSIFNKSKNHFRELILKERFQRVSEIILVREDRSCIVGNLPSGGIIVSIVNLKSGKLEDTIWASLNLSFSHFNRFIAFMRFVPKFHPPGFSALILAYDLKKTPQANRLGNISLEDKENVGVPVYPPGNAAARSYDPFLSADTFNYVSPILWAKDDTFFLFVVTRGTRDGPLTNFLVSVPVQEEAVTWKASEMPIDVSSLVDVSLQSEELMQQIQEQRFTLWVDQMDWLEFPEVIELSTYFVGRLSINLRPVTLGRQE